MATGEKNLLDFDAELAKKLGELDEWGGVRLPFPVGVGFWLNGQAALKHTKNAAYFGGWAFTAETLDEAAEQIGPIPPDFILQGLANRQGQEFEAYLVRWLGIAPIVKRWRWVKTGEKDGKETGYTHTQILAIIATYVGDEYIAWGPAILSAKGYAGGYIRKALEAWTKQTASARKELGLPPSKIFYAPIGTYGEKPNTENVGKPGAQSPITPAQLIVPENGISVPYMKRAYVTAQMVGKMWELAGRAEAWVNEWRKPKDGNGDNSGSNDGETISF